MVRIGLISDTHGLLRPEALEFLRGSDHIVHAGDVGDFAILDTLAAIAPLTAVRGNNDRGAAWVALLPETACLALGPVRVHVVHILAGWQPPAGAADVQVGVQVVVHGHSHRPQVEARGGLLCVNPGSAGPRRFKLPVALGELWIDGSAVDARTVELGLPGG